MRRFRGPRKRKFCQNQKYFSRRGIARLKSVFLVSARRPRRSLACATIAAQSPPRSSDAAPNLIDLMRNEEAAGWNARAKGPWNIESRNTVSQSSPLTYLSLYSLTGDEDFYRRFALPSLEFLLSRPGPHFAAEREIWDNYYQHQPMRGPGSYFGASTFASAFAMTHGRSPVFGALCLDEKGAARVMHGGGHTQTFADLLAMF